MPTRPRNVPIELILDSQEKAGLGQVVLPLMLAQPQSPSRPSTQFRI